MSIWGCHPTDGATRSIGLCEPRLSCSNATRVGGAHLRNLTYLYQKGLGLSEATARGCY